MSDPVKVGVFFGSRSVEHEVSVITAQQAMAAMPSDRMIPVPVYIAKTGAWYTGDHLLQLERYKDIDKLIATSTRVTMRPEPGSGGELIEVEGRRGLLGGSSRTAARFDVAMPLVHGSNGEDGTLQGLFELAGVPYCGCDVASAAVSMDKRLARTTLRGAGLPVLDDVAVARARWLDGAGAVCASLERSPGYPMYVKPLRLGSSIGVSRVENREQLDAALDLAFRYDTSILAEAAQDGIVEINCSVLGRGDDVQVSVCEQPKIVGNAQLRGQISQRWQGQRRCQSTGDRDEERTTGHSGANFRNADPADPGLGDGGISRHRSGRSRARRLLVAPDRDSFLINELNTLPGSLSFYLWEASGMTFAALLDRLVEMAMARQHERQATTSSIDTWLLTGRPG